MKIKAKLFITYMVVVIFTVTSISMLNIHIIEQGLADDLNHYSSNYLEEFAKNIDEVSQLLLNQIYQKMDKCRINDKENYTYFMQGYNRDNTARREFVKTCKQMMSLNPYINGIGFIDKKLNYYYEGNNGDRKYSSLIKEYLLKFNQGYNSIYGLDQDYFLILKPINDKDTLERLGYCGFLVSQDYYLRYIKFSINTNGWLVNFLDHQDRIIFSSNVDAREHGLFIIGNREKMMSASQYIYKGNKYLCNEMKTPHQDINIMITIPGKVITESTYRLKHAILIFSFIIIIVGIFISLFMSNQLSKSTAYVASRIKEIAKGHFEQRIQIKSKDEIAMIGREINEMAEAIQNLIDKVYKVQIKQEITEREAVEFEYAALYERMNPHFIYNVLEGINSMAKLNGSTDISQCVCLLAAILHDTLDDKRKIVFLEDEIEHVCQYIELKKLMRRDQFEFKLSLDEELLGAKVPRYIIQPLIENAFKHGIDKVEKKGWIELNCRLEQKNLVIEVKDNGYQQVSSAVKAHADEHLCKNTGIGLDSINKRIKILYGKEYGVHIEQIDGMTSVKIKFPYTIQGGEENV